MKTSIIILSLFCLSVQGLLKLPTFLDSNMVLQRGPQKAVIWGWDSPGTGITIALALGTKAIVEKYNTTVDSTGNWSITFNPQPAETKCSIHITTTGNQQKELLNIAFGDVYLCSGQSNM